MKPRRQSQAKQKAIPNMAASAPAMVAATIKVFIVVASSYPDSRCAFYELSLIARSIPPELPVSLPLVHWPKPQGLWLS
jgi:hypothetical protein